jgi:hypothetical protein
MAETDDMSIWDMYSKEMFKGSRLITGLGVLSFLLVVYIFASHSSSRQAIHDELRAACHEAVAGNKTQVVKDFEDVAARDSGYLLASYGAALWADGNNQPFNFLGEGANTEAIKSINSFFSLCELDFNPTRWSK